jgi:hypothetical protein
MLHELESEIAEYNQMIESAYIVNPEPRECDSCIFPKHFHDVEKACCCCYLAWKDGLY